MAGINGIDQAENVTNEKFGKENGIESSKKQGISFPAVFSPLYVPFGIQRFARITSFGVSFSNSNN